MSREVERIWRVRGWVRGIVLALTALLLSLSFVWPSVLNPTWTGGLPADQYPAVGFFCAIAAACVWTAFRSRLILREETFTVVNPWGRRTGRVEDIVKVTAGDTGTVIHLTGDRRMVVFAVQCTKAFRGRPRWVAVATALTCQEPRWHSDNEDTIDPPDFPCEVCGHDDFYHPSLKRRRQTACAACIWEEDIGRRAQEVICRRRYTGRGQPLSD